MAILKYITTVCKDDYVNETNKFITEKEKKFSKKVFFERRNFNWLVCNK